MDDVFARIARGEVDAHVLCETPTELAILDIAPTVPGQTILFSKHDSQVLAQLEPGARTSLFVTLQRVRRAIARGIDCAGVTTIVNQGPAAGQQAPRVLLETIPRTAERLLPEHTVRGPPSPEVRDALSPLLGTPDRFVSISIPSDRLADGEIRITDASVDLFEELGSDRIAMFAELVNDVSARAFEALEAQGTTIVISSGADQDALGAVARIIPRWDGDGLSFSYNGEAGDLREVRDRIIEKLESSARPKREPENYLLKQLQRIP